MKCPHPLTEYYYGKCPHCPDTAPEPQQDRGGIKSRMIPEHWPPHHNANKEPCDVIGFPCSCGSIHFEKDEWVQEMIHEYGWEKPQQDRDALVELIRKAVKEYHEGLHLYPIGQEVEFVVDAIIAAGWRK